MRQLRRFLYPRWMRAGRVIVGLAVLGVFTLLAALAPWIAPNDPQAQDLAAALRPVSLFSAYPLGTDSVGRCVMSRLLYGARTSWVMAACAVSSAILLGIVPACAASLVQGWADRAATGVARLGLVLPPLLLALVLASDAEAGLSAVALAVFLTQWPRTWRTARRTLAAEGARDHAIAARMLGTPPWRAFLQEVAPGLRFVLPPLLASAMAEGIVLEAGLSFLGLGVADGDPSWGRMIADGREIALLSAPALLAPCALLVAVVAGCNLLAEGLRATLGRPGGATPA